MAADQLQTFASDQRLFDQLFQELPRHYSVLQTQEIPDGQMRVFTLNSDIFFVVGQNAARASQLLFKNTQGVMYLTPKEVSQSRPEGPCVPLLPVTAKNLEDLSYQALTNQCLEVSLYMVSQGRVARTNVATPGNLRGFIDYCPQLLNVQTYRALAIVENTAHAEQQVTILFADNYDLNIIQVMDDARNYQNLLVCLFQCQVSELIIINQQNNVALQQVLELNCVRYEVVGHIPETGSQAAGLNVRVSTYFGESARGYDFQELISRYLLDRHNADRFADNARINFLTTSQYVNLTQKEVEQLEYNEVIKLFQRQLKSDCGRQLIGQFMVRPLNDRALIQQRQTYLVFLAGLNARDRARYLHALNGIGVVCRRLFNVDVGDARQLASVTKLVFSLYQYIRDDVERLVHFFVGKYDGFAASQASNQTAQLIPELAEVHNSCRAVLDPIRQLIVTYIIPSDCVFAAFSQQCVLINPNLDEDLKANFAVLAETHEQIQRHGTTLAEGLSIENPAHCKLFCTQANRLSFKLPYAYLKQVEAQTSRFQIKVLEKKQTGLKITTDSLQELNQRFCDEYDRYGQISRRYVVELYNKLIGYFPFLEQLLRAVGTIDIMNAFQIVSQQHGFHRPEFVDGDGGVSYREVYNPVLLSKVQFVQKNDFCLNAMATVITGANSGGKTQILKSIGNNQLLAQLGCHCAGRIVTRVHDKLCLRFGSADDLGAGMSTFMYEMVQLSQILQFAGHNSLVLIDELGRGTSVQDGFALSIAVINELLGKKVKCVFVTHLFDVVYYLLSRSELVSQIKFFKMVSEVQNKELVLLYRLEEGIDKSHGIEVAQMCGIDQTVIDSALEWQEIRGGSSAEWRGADTTDTTGNNWDSLLIQYQMGLISKDQLRSVFTHQ